MAVVDVVPLMESPTVAVHVDPVQEKPMVVVLVVNFVAAAAGQQRTLASSVLSPDTTSRHLTIDSPAL